MTMILKNVFLINELKIVITLVLLVVGVVLILRKKEPKFIREMKIELEDRERLKKMIGALTVFAALLYPAEICLSMILIASEDFINLFWSGGIIVIGVILMLLINYYHKK